MLQIANQALLNDRLDEAEHHYTAVLNKHPDNDQALFGLGCVLTRRGHHGAAIPYYQMAYDINPKNLSAAYNLAAVLGKVKKKEAAREIYANLSQTVLAADIPNKTEFLADIYGNWSGLFINSNQSYEAVRIGRKALECDPGHADGNNHVALGLMELGKWDKALPHWERRLTRREFHKRNYAPVWNGEKTGCLVIHGEQGIGDEIMFLSALDEVRHLADEIVVECNGRLVNVVTQSFNVPAYASEREVMENHNPTAQIAMGSLFLQRRKSPRNCHGKPYLKANPALVRKYRNRLNGPRVGLAWMGGTDRTHYEVRQIALDGLTPFFNAPVEFVSLQYGDVSREADRFGLHHWQHAIDDIEHQVALIESCDLVITTCQSVVHFAGALGKETWCLTPDQVRWCYGLQGSEMPLYKSVTMYRKGDYWGETIYKVAKALDQKFMRKAA